MFSFLRLLNEKYTQLVQTLTQAAASNQMPSNDELLTRRLNGMSEDIHWLLLIAGFALFEANSDDQARIPDEIMAYSIRCTRLVDLNLLNEIMSRLTCEVAVAAAVRSAPILDSIATRLVETCLSSNDPVDPLTSIFFRYSTHKHIVYL